MGCAFCGTSYTGYSYFLGRPRLRFAPVVDDCSMDRASLGASLSPSDAIFTCFVQAVESEKGKSNLLVLNGICFPTFSPLNMKSGSAQEMP